MNLTGLKGNAHLYERLRGPLAHAYILSGPAGSGREELADIIARALICTAEAERPCNACAGCKKALRGAHPDIQYTGGGPAEKGKKQEIPVGEIRRITTDAHTLPNEAEHKVYIVRAADTMNPSAQNAFLKMLEEPPAFCTFLLLAENPLALLPTVRSRCIHLQLIPPGEAAADGEGGDRELVENFLAASAAGGLSLLAFCVGLEKVDRPALAMFVENCHQALCEKLKTTGPDGRQALMAAVDLFADLRDDLRYNVSGGHISGKIAATLI